MRRVPTTKVVLAVALLVALLLAGVLSFYASAEPDGLNRVAEDHGFSKAEERHVSDDSPLAGYDTRGVGDERLSRGAAGVVGSLVVLVLAGGLALAVRRRGGTTQSDSERQPVEHGGD
jgi:cobalt/nickel transport protein